MIQVVQDAPPGPLRPVSPQSNPMHSRSRKHPHALLSHSQFAMVLCAAAPVAYRHRPPVGHLWYTSLPYDQGSENCRKIGGDFEANSGNLNKSWFAREWVKRRLFPSKPPCFGAMATKNAQSSGEAAIPPGRLPCSCRNVGGVVSRAVTITSAPRHRPDPAALTNITLRSLSRLLPSERQFLDFRLNCRQIRVQFVKGRAESSRLWG